MNETTTFNEYDPKYMYWLHTFHVTTLTTAICVIALLWYLLSMIDVLFVRNYQSFRIIQTIYNLLFIMFSSTGFALAFMGIMNSESYYIFYATATPFVCAVGYAGCTLFLLGACTPDSFLQTFYQYIYKKSCELEGIVYDENDYFFDTLYFVVYYGYCLVINFFVGYMFCKCYEYYKDQSEYNQYPSLQTCTQLIEI